MISFRKNSFGKTLDVLVQPVKAVIGVIDINGYNVELYRVGLSAIQLFNLGISEQFSPQESTAQDTGYLTETGLRERNTARFGEWAERITKANEHGLLDGREFGRINVRYNKKDLQAQVYNAFGEKSIKEPSKIRISSMLANDLEVDLGDKVELYLKK